MLLKSEEKSGVLKEEFNPSSIEGLPPIGSYVTNGFGSAFKVIRHVDVSVSWSGFYKDFGPCAIIELNGHETRIELEHFNSGKWTTL